MEIPRYRIVIPSHRRPKSAKRMLSLFPTAFFSVGEDEVQEYVKAGVPQSKIISRPHETNGNLSRVRNWINLHVKEEIVVQLDDDITSVYSMVGRTPRKIDDPAAILRVIENTMICARDAGTAVFAWGNSMEPFNHVPHDPIRLYSPPSGAIGFIGKKIRLDENIITKGDCLDLLCQVLLEWRIIFVDSRFVFNHGRVGKNTGGLQLYRTAESEKYALEYLKKKWGFWICNEIKKRGKTTKMYVRVPRRIKM